MKNMEDQVEITVKNLLEKVINLKKTEQLTEDEEKIEGVFAPKKSLFKASRLKKNNK